MATNREDLQASYSVDTKGAQKSLNELGKSFDGVTKQTAKSSKGLLGFDKSLDTVFKGVTALNQGIELSRKAYNAVAGSIETVIDAYATQERAQKGLTDTLKLQNQFSQAAVDDFTKFASKLQEISVVGDEVTLGFLKQAKAMGLSNKQAKDAVTAAANLSAATGRDLNSAFAQTLKTFGGFAGELGEVIPEMKNLTATQLQAGKATELLNEKFRGQAEALADTFSGSATQRANAFGDLLETIGKQLVLTFDLTTVNKALTRFFVDMQSAVETVGAAIRSIDFQKIVKGLTEVGTTLSALVIPKLSLMAAPIILATAKITLMTLAIGGTIAAIDLLIRNIFKLDEVWELFKRTAIAGWRSLTLVVLESWDFILEKLILVTQKIEEFGGTAGEMAAKATKSLKGIKDELLNGIVIATIEADEGVGKLKESFEGIDDKGALGGVVDIVKEIARQFETGVNPQIEQTAKKVDDAANSMKKMIDITKAEEAVLRKLNAENAKLAREAAAIGATVEERQALEQLGLRESLALQLDSLGLETDKAKAIAGSLLQQRLLISSQKDQRNLSLEQNKVLADLGRVLADVQNQYLLLIGDIAAVSPAEQAILNQRDALKKLAVELRNSGVIAFDTGRVLSKVIDEFGNEAANILDPGNFSGKSKQIVKTIVDIIVTLNKLADGADKTFGEAIADNITKSVSGVRNALNAIEDFGADLGKNIANDLEKLGFDEWADEMRKAASEITPFRFAISKEDQEAIADFVDETISFVSTTFNAISDSISTAFDAISTGADFFSGAADFILSFDETAIEVLEGLPDMIARAMQNIPKFIDALGKAFKEGIFAITKGAGKMLQDLKPVLKQFVNDIADGLTELLDKIPGIAFKLMEAVVPAFQEMLSRLPDLITKFFDALPAFIDAFISFIPDIAVALADAMPEIVERFIKGFIGAMGKIVASFIDTFITKGGAWEIAVAFTKAMISMIPAIVDGIATGLKNALGSIWKGFSYPLPDISELERKVDGFFNKIQQNAVKVADQVFSVIDIPEDGGAQSAAKQAEKVINAIIEGGVKQVRGLLDALRLLWKWVYEKIIKPLETLWKWVYNSVILPLMNFIKFLIGGIIQTTVEVIKRIIEGIIAFFERLPETIQEAFQFLVDLFETMGEVVKEAFQFLVDLFATMGETVHEAFQFLVDLFEGLKKTVDDAWEGVKTNIIDKLSLENINAAFKDVAASIGDILNTEKVKTAFSPVTDVFKNILDTEKIKSAFSSVTSVFSDLKNAMNRLSDLLTAESVITTLKSLGGPFERLSKALETAGYPLLELARALEGMVSPFKDLADALKKFSIGGITGGGGGGVVGQVVDFVSSGGGLFANGGLVKNPGFVETPGEFVLKKSAVDSLGADTLDFMNRTGQMPSASGGKVLNIQSGAIQITQLPGENSQDLAERVLDEIKRRSVNGETVIFASGIRDR